MILRKTFLLLLSLLFTVFVLSGCSNLQEPTKPEDNLLIGRVTLQAQNFENFGNISINGTIGKNIQVTLINTETGKRFNVTTADEGVFSKRNCEPGQYRIEKFLYQANALDSQFRYTSNIYCNVQSEQIITISTGIVIDLGSLVWYCDGALNRSWFQPEGSPEALKDYFAQFFPESLWLEREWVMTQVTGK